MPQEANDLVQWFEDNYVLGRIRREMRNGYVVRSALPFPPQCGRSGGGMSQVLIVMETNSNVRNIFLVI
ncbi:unnamed protein product [Rhizophagus irregularis]|nr:unnamed protein product [Rhizophagus irregularis]